MFDEVQRLVAEIQRFTAAVDGCPDHELAPVVGAVQRLSNVVADLERTVAAKVARSDTWSMEGHRSAVSWIAFHAGVRRAEAARRVREADVLAELPEVGALAREGVIDSFRVRLIGEARALAPETFDVGVRDDFVNAAARGSLAELRALGRAWSRDATTSREERRPPPEPHLRLRRRSDGLLTGTFLLRPEDGDLLETSVEAGVDAYLRAARDGDPTVGALTLTSVRAQTLVDLVARAARRAPGDGSVPDRYRVAVVVHVGDEEPSGGRWAPAEALCDAEHFRVVLGARSEVLDVGTSTARWPRAIRRAITVRDRHCTFPGCDRPPSHCDVHHCQERERGGATAVTNGTLLCRHHHVFLHRHRWSVELDGCQQPVFRRPDGSRYEAVSYRPLAA